MIAALLAYAEFESLRVIVIDKPQSGNFDIVAAALTAAAALLILGGLVGLQSGARESS
jgi:hypothetical protein